MMGPGGGMYGNNSFGLTPEKQTVVQKLYADHYTATAQIRQQLLAKQSELNAQLYNGTSDDQKVQSLTKEVGTLQTKLLEAQVNLRRQLIKEGIPAMGHGMGGCGMGGGY